MFKSLAIVKNSEKDLLEKIEEYNKDHNSLWKIPNLLVPILTIVLAMVCLLAFSDKRWGYLNYFNLIINGSLPLIAINQISAIGIFIFKFDKSQEKRLGTDTFMLRTKLLSYSLLILVIGILLFAFQVITNPFDDIILLLFMVISSLFLVWFSSYVSRRIFLLQEDFIERTFDAEMRNVAKSKHGKNWKE